MSKMTKDLQKLRDDRIEKHRKYIKKVQKRLKNHISLCCGSPVEPWLDDEDDEFPVIDTMCTECNQHCVAVYNA